MSELSSAIHGLDFIFVGLLFSYYVAKWQLMIVLFAIPNDDDCVGDLEAIERISMDVASNELIRTQARWVGIVYL